MYVFMQYTQIVIIQFFIDSVNMRNGAEAQIALAWEEDNTMHSPSLINYVGWLGHQNLGDEALYIAIQKTFRKYSFVPSLLNEYSNITFFGGGTIIPSFCKRIRPNKYNYVFGSGVRDPEFFGRFDSVIIDRLKSFKFRLLGVRDNFSKSILEEWEIDSEVIGDPCLSLENKSHEKRDDLRIAINIGSDGRIWGQDEKYVLLEIIKVCRTLKKNGYKLILVPLNPEDIDYINILSLQTGIEIFRNWSDIYSVLNLLSSCKLMIGERLHSLVFSASVYTPFISLEYRPKCKHFSESVGFSKYGIRTDEISANKIIEMSYDIMDNWNKMNRILEREVKSYRKIQSKFANLLIDDIEFLPNDKYSIPSITHRIKDKIFWKTEPFITRASGLVF